MEQVGGDGSTNFQANRDIHVSGLTRGEARELFLEMFHENFYRFKENALELVNKRMLDFTDKFLERMFATQPNASKKLEEPAVQASIFEAQKEYAKHGDSELEERLLTVLVERIGSEEKSMKRIVLDEALNVIPKLTNDQINILALIFVILHPPTIVNRNQLNAYVESLAAFYPENPMNMSQFTHLQYCGCCVTLGEGKSIKTLPVLLLQNLTGIFNKGFEKEKLGEVFGPNVEEVRHLFISNLHYQNKIQVGFMNLDALYEKLEKENLTRHKLQLQSLFNEFIMSDDDVTKLLININGRLEGLMNEWARTEFKTLIPTAIGFVIAIMHYNKVTGNAISFDEFIS